MLQPKWLCRIVAVIAGGGHGMTDVKRRSAKVRGKAACNEDRQRLEYVADLLAELQGIVTGAGTETLRGLMVLAQHEAVALANPPDRQSGRGDA